MIINKKMRTCRIVDFAIPADHRAKIKENEKKDKYTDRVSQLKEIRNMIVTPLVTGALGMITKDLVMG